MADCSNAIGWNAHAAGMFTDAILIRGEINAIHFVFGNVTVEPLNL